MADSVTIWEQLSPDDHEFVGRLSNVLGPEEVAAMQRAIELPAAQRHLVCAYCYADRLGKLFVAKFLDLILFPQNKKQLDAEEWLYKRHREGLLQQAHDGGIHRDYAQALVVLPDDWLGLTTGARVARVHDLLALVRRLYHRCKEQSILHHADALRPLFLDDDCELAVIQARMQLIRDKVGRMPSSDYAYSPPPAPIPMPIDACVAGAQPAALTEIKTVEVQPADAELTPPNLVGSVGAKKQGRPPGTAEQIRNSRRNRVVLAIQLYIRQEHKVPSSLNDLLKCIHGVVGLRTVRGWMAGEGGVVFDDQFDDLIVQALKKLAPDLGKHGWFQEIAHRWNIA